jgi:hypothetical protein
MPKRKKQRWPDENELAYEFVQRTGVENHGEPSKSEVSRVMAALGRRGGKIGGKRRMQTMTSEQRHQIAVKAARARWRKHEGSV